MTNARIRATVEVAMEKLNLAEAELATAMQALNARPRAEKVQVSQNIESAFSKLKAAKEELAALLPATDDDGDDV